MIQNALVVVRDHRVAFLGILFVGACRLQDINNEVVLQVNETTGIPICGYEAWGMNYFRKYATKEDLDFIKHVNAYPVIFLNFRSADSNLAASNKTPNCISDGLLECLRSYEWLFGGVVERNDTVTHMTKNQIYALRSAVSGKDVSVAYLHARIMDLSEMLYLHFGNKKVMVFIDDETDVDDRSDITRLMKEFGKSTYIERLFITSSMKSYYGNVNITEVRCWKPHSLVNFYGFSQSEVDELCVSHGIAPNQKEALEKVHMGDYLFNKSQFDNDEDRFNRALYDLRRYKYAWDDYNYYKSLFDPNDVSDDRYVSSNKVYCPYEVVRYIEEFVK